MGYEITPSKYPTMCMEIGDRHPGVMIGGVDRRLMGVRGALRFHSGDVDKTIGSLESYDVVPIDSITHIVGIVHLAPETPEAEFGQRRIFSPQSVSRARCCRVSQVERGWCC